jgi:hypothetical protein
MDCVTFEHPVEVTKEGKKYINEEVNNENISVLKPYLWPHSSCLVI